MLKVCIRCALLEIPLVKTSQVRGGMVKTPALYNKGRRFEPHRRRFFTSTVVLLSFNKPETVLWTIAKILLYYYYYNRDMRVVST